MPTKLEFSTPEGRISLSIDDVQFMAYDAGELAMKSTRDFVGRMRAMGLGELAETYARLIAQYKVSELELREAREEAEALLGSKEESGTIEKRIMPRLEAVRETIARTQIDLRENVERMAALSAACDYPLHQIPGYRPPARTAR
ncbi:hypothetical protein AWB77_01377 [Caballeronia fortuita]|uniref:Uncharacterized protein n=1 Tax=Caballeronia fortuita TaxID=1777138 RepID=A0A158A3G5_9BURK|nr:hypothetical protein [Caballeronia fortuita]SAK52176.1 hypothetical protein AWB77_01377 [Caballeronia fortuita]